MAYKPIIRLVLFIFRTFQGLEQHRSMQHLCKPAVRIPLENNRSRVARLWDHAGGLASDQWYKLYELPHKIPSLNFLFLFNFNIYIYIWDHAVRSNVLDTHHPNGAPPIYSSSFNDHSSRKRNCKKGTICFFRRNKITL